MNNVKAILQRELSGYFATPVAYVFIVIFLLLSSTFTFYLGGFYERGQADLLPFFSFHPWLYLFLVPALSMRLWAEERKSGTIELLLTLPVSLMEAVLGKFLAAWCFTALALVTYQGARILGYRLGELKTGANKLEIPITARLAPNFELASEK